MRTDNATAIKNLKIGIMKDLHKHGLITQKQMELAIMHVYRRDAERLNTDSQKIQKA